MDDNSNPAATPAVVRTIIALGVLMHVMIFGGIVADVIL